MAAPAVSRNEWHKEVLPREERIGQWWQTVLAHEKTTPAIRDVLQAQMALMQVPDVVKDVARLQDEVFRSDLNGESVGSLATRIKEGKEGTPASRWSQADGELGKKLKAVMDQLRSGIKLEEFPLLVAHVRDFAVVLDNVSPVSPNIVFQDFVRKIIAGVFMPLVYGALKSMDLSVGYATAFWMVMNHTWEALTVMKRRFARDGYHQRFMLSLYAHICKLEPSCTFGFVWKEPTRRLNPVVGEILNYIRPDVPSTAMMNYIVILPDFTPECRDLLSEKQLADLKLWCNQHSVASTTPGQDDLSHESVPTLLSMEIRKRLRLDGEAPSADTQKSAESDALAPRFLSLGNEPPMHFADAFDKTNTLEENFKPRAVAELRNGSEWAPTDLVNEVKLIADGFRGTRSANENQAEVNQLMTKVNDVHCRSVLKATEAGVPADYFKQFTAFIENIAKDRHSETLPVVVELRKFIADESDAFASSTDSSKENVAGVRWFGGMRLLNFADNTQSCVAAREFFASLMVDVEKTEVGRIRGFELLFAGPYLGMVELALSHPKLAKNSPSGSTKGVLPPMCALHRNQIEYLMRFSMILLSGAMLTRNQEFQHSMLFIILALASQYPEFRHIGPVDNVDGATVASLLIERSSNFGFHPLPAKLSQLIFPMVVEHFYEKRAEYVRHSINNKGEHTKWFMDSLMSMDVSHPRYAKTKQMAEALLLDLCSTDDINVVMNTRGPDGNPLQSSVKSALPSLREVCHRVDDMAKTMPHLERFHEQGWAKKPKEMNFDAWFHYCTHNAADFDEAYMEIDDAISKNEGSLAHFVDVWLPEFDNHVSWIVATHARAVWLWMESLATKFVTNVAQRAQHFVQSIFAKEELRGKRESIHKYLVAGWLIPLAMYVTDMLPMMPEDPTVHYVRAFVSEFVKIWGNWLEEKDPNGPGCACTGRMFLVIFTRICKRQPSLRFSSESLIDAMHSALQSRARHANAYVDYIDGLGDGYVREAQPTDIEGIEWASTQLRGESKAAAERILLRLRVAVTNEHQRNTLLAELLQEEDKKKGKGGKGSKGGKGNKQQQESAGKGGKGGKKNSNASADSKPRKTPTPEPEPVDEPEKPAAKEVPAEEQAEASARPAISLLVDSEAKWFDTFRKHTAEHNKAFDAVAQSLHMLDVAEAPTAAFFTERLPDLLADRNKFSQLCLQVQESGESAVNGEGDEEGGGLASIYFVKSLLQQCKQAQQKKDAVKFLIGGPLLGMAKTIAASLGDDGERTLDVDYAFAIFVRFTSACIQQAMQVHLRSVAAVAMQLYARAVLALAVDGGEIEQQVLLVTLPTTDYDPEDAEPEVYDLLDAFAASVDSDRSNPALVDMLLAMVNHSDDNKTAIRDHAALVEKLRALATTKLSKENREAVRKVLEVSGANEQQQKTTSKKATPPAEEAPATPASPKKEKETKQPKKEESAPPAKVEKEKPDEKPAKEKNSKEKAKEAAAAEAAAAAKAKNDERKTTPEQESKPQVVRVVQQTTMHEKTVAMHTYPNLEPLYRIVLVRQIQKKFPDVQLVSDVEPASGKRDFHGNEWVRIDWKVSSTSAKHVATVAQVLDEQDKRRALKLQALRAGRGTDIVSDATGMTALLDDLPHHLPCVSGFAANGLALHINSLRIFESDVIYDSSFPNEEQLQKLVRKQIKDVLHLYASGARKAAPPLPQRMSPAATVVTKQPTTVTASSEAKPAQKEQPAAPKANAWVVSSSEGKSEDSAATELPPSVAGGSVWGDKARERAKAAEPEPAAAPAEAPAATGKQSPKKDKKEKEKKEEANKSVTQLLDDAVKKSGAKKAEAAQQQQPTSPHSAPEQQAAAAGGLALPKPRSKQAEDSPKSMIPQPRSQQHGTSLSAAAAGMTGLDRNERQPPASPATSATSSGKGASLSAAAAMIAGGGSSEPPAPSDPLVSGIGSFTVAESSDTPLTFGSNASASSSDPWNVTSSNKSPAATASGDPLAALSRGWTISSSANNNSNNQTGDVPSPLLGSSATSNPFMSSQPLLGGGSNVGTPSTSPAGGAFNAERSISQLLDDVMGERTASTSSANAGGFSMGGIGDTGLDFMGSGGSSHASPASLQPASAPIPPFLAPPTPPGASPFGTPTTSGAPQQQMQRSGLLPISAIMNDLSNYFVGLVTVDPTGRLRLRNRRATAVDPLLVDLPPGIPVFPGDILAATIDPQSQWEMSNEFSCDEPHRLQNALRAAPVRDATATLQAMRAAAPPMAAKNVPRMNNNLTIPHAKVVSFMAASELAPFACRFDPRSQLMHLLDTNGNQMPALASLPFENPENFMYDQDCLFRCTVVRNADGSNCRCIIRNIERGGWRSVGSPRDFPTTRPFLDTGLNVQLPQPTSTHNAHWHGSGRFLVNVEVGQEGVVLVRTSIPLFTLDQDFRADAAAFSSPFAFAGGRPVDDMRARNTMTCITFSFRFATDAVSGDVTCVAKSIAPSAVNPQMGLIPQEVDQISKLIAFARPQVPGGAPVSDLDEYEMWMGACAGETLARSVPEAALLVRHPRLATGSFGNVEFYMPEVVQRGAMPSTALVGIHASSGFDCFSSIAKPMTNMADKLALRLLLIADKRLRNGPQSMEDTNFMRDIPTHVSRLNSFVHVWGM